MRRSVLRFPSMRSTWSPDVMPRTAVRGRAMSLDEWAELDEDAEGELVDGFLVEEEVPNVAPCTS